MAAVCRKHGISAPTYYTWKSKYASATVSDLTRVRGLEAMEKDAEVIDALTRR